MIIGRNGATEAAAKILNEAGVPAAKVTVPEDGPIIVNSSGYVLWQYADRVVTVEARTAPDDPATLTTEILNAATAALGDAGWTVKPASHNTARAVAPKGLELPDPPQEAGPYIINDDHQENLWCIRDETGDIGYVEGREVPRELPRGNEPHWDGHRRIVWTFYYTLINPDEDADLDDSDVLRDPREFDQLEDACKAALLFYPTYRQEQQRRYGDLQ